MPKRLCLDIEQWVSARYHQGPLSPKGNNKPRS